MQGTAPSRQNHQADKVPRGMGAWWLPIPSLPVQICQSSLGRCHWLWAGRRGESKDQPWKHWETLELAVLLGAT